MFPSPDHPELCDHHAQQELRTLDRAPILPLAAELLSISGEDIDPGRSRGRTGRKSQTTITDFRSAAAINAVLGNALVQLADGRLDPRRAAILTYMAQNLMQTLRKVGWEKIDSSPTPNLEQALRATLRASVSKSDAQKFIRQLYGAALNEGGPSSLKLK